MANERFLIGDHFSSVSRQARPSLSPNRSSTRKTSWLRLDGTIDGICKLRWIGLGDANTRIEPARLSYEQLGAGQGELHIGAALVEPQPAAFDREFIQGRRLRFMARNSARLASSAANLIQAALNRFMQSARSFPWPADSISRIGRAVSMPQIQTGSAPV